jgi:hypothetical protein
MIWNNINKISDLNEYFESLCPYAMLVEGYDDCIIGIQLLKPNNTHVIYSKSAMIKKMMVRDDISFDDAYTYFTEIVEEAFSLNKNVMPLFVEDLPNPKLN